jgi:hypothetical protein
MASFTGGQLHLKVRQCLFKSSSILLECVCLFLDKMPGRVNARLIGKKSGALPSAIYYLLGRINGGNAFRFPHSDYLTRQIGSLAIAAYFSLDDGVCFARDELKGLAGVLSKNGVGLVIAFVRAPSSILRSRAPG